MWYCPGKFGVSVLEFTDDAHLFTVLTVMMLLFEWHDLRQGPRLPKSTESCELKGCDTPYSIF